MTRVRLMTFNVRGAPPEDGVNIWQNRAAHAVALIKEIAPEVIGFQEVQAENLKTFQSELKEYAYEIGPMSNRLNKILFNAIFWKMDAFQCARAGGFYLSTTPDVWSKDWDSGRVRVVNWVKLRHTKERFEFFHLNTHLDHIGRMARVQGSKILVRHLNQIMAEPLPVFLTGDFNSAPEIASQDSTETPYGVFQNSGFTDVFRSVHVENGAKENTFHGFQGNQFGVNGNLAALRIDWILMRAPSHSLAIESSAIIRNAAPPIFPSDHYPVIADVRL